MNKYQLELQRLRPDDEIQTFRELADYPYSFISTASHGYLVVPAHDTFAHLAKSVLISSGYGYKGILAYYLEEDCDANDFLTCYKQLNK